MVASCKLLYCIKGLVWLSWFHKFSMSWSCNVWGTSWVARWLWRNCTYDCSRPGKDQQMVWSAVQFGPWGIYLQDGLDLLGSNLMLLLPMINLRHETWWAPKFLLCVGIKLMLLTDLEIHFHVQEMLFIGCWKGQNVIMKDEHTFANEGLTFPCLISILFF